MERVEPSDTSERDALERAVSCAVVRRGRLDGLLLVDWVATGDVEWVKRWGFESIDDAMNAVDAALSRIAPPDAADRAHRELVAANAMAESVGTFLQSNSDRREVADLGRMLRAMRLRIPLFDIVRNPPPPVDATASQRGSDGKWTSGLQDRHDGLTFSAIARRHGDLDADAAAQRVRYDLAAYLERAASPARDRRTQLLDLEIAELMSAGPRPAFDFDGVRGLLARRIRAQGLPQAARSARRRVASTTPAHPPGTGR